MGKKAGVVVERSTQEQKYAHFIVHSDIQCAGVHLLVDVRGVSFEVLNDTERIEWLLQEAARRAGATMLSTHLHRFSPNGVTGVLLLAESHISIHTWPEARFAAIDVFMCGKTEPHKTLRIIKDWLQPEGMEVEEVLRGRIDGQKMTTKRLLPGFSF